MGIFDAITDAISDTLAGQMLHTIKPDVFRERSIIVPGIDEDGNELKGELANGSIIIVPDNTFAVILDHDTIEGFIKDPGKYVYEDGACSIFNGDGIGQSFTNRVSIKIGFNGKEIDKKRIVYLNLKDIRNIMYGTYTPIMYHDSAYNTDFEISACGRFSIRIHDPLKFFTEFVPLSTSRLSSDDESFKTELGSIILQAMTKTLNRLSGKHSIREISSCTDVIRNAIMTDDDHVLYWKENYGFSLTNLIIESLDYSDETKRIIKNLSQRTYEDNIQVERKQKSISIRQRETMTFEDQVDAVMKLQKLKEMGILTNSEFEKKKKELLGL